MTTETTAAASPLDSYVGTAKAAGVPDRSLIAMLRQRGWSERRVLESLASYYTARVGVAPPGRASSDERAHDAFLYLLNFITLGFWTVALGQLLYAFIARAFPDAAQVTYGPRFVDEVAWQIAVIVVAFPVFMIVGRLIARELRLRPDAAFSGVRAWLTYVSLVLAALVVMTDAIWFVNAFIRGELTMRFVLDELVLLVLGGGVFGYYLGGLRAAKASPR